jgi:hypothetical protein
MGDVHGAPTTGLLKGMKFIKDNRLLPKGFEKASADQDIAVIGEASRDPDFMASGDHIRYSVDTAGRQGPFQIDVELVYQPVSFRWADNLRQYQSVETTRFVSYYDSMSSVSSHVLAHGSATAR